MKLKKVKLLVVALLTSIGVNAQNLLVTLTNANIESFAVADIQSIKFGSGVMILNELDGTINTWNIDDIDNYAFDGLTNVDKRKSITTEEINVFPNPTSDKVNINYFSTLSGDISIDVYDFNGRLIEQLFKGKHQENTVLTWSARQNGMVHSGKYFIKITTSNKIITKPVIIQ